MIPIYSKTIVEHIELKQIQKETDHYIKQGLLILRVLKTACPKAEIAISTAIISSFVCKKQTFLMLIHCILIRYREIKRNINWPNHLNDVFYSKIGCPIKHFYDVTF